MPDTDVTPKRIQKAVEQGFKRLENFRSARMMFLRQYVGQYYDAERGGIGTEPMNLIFNAIRVLVANLVSNFPTHSVRSRFIAQRDYADMLGLALAMQDKKMKIRETYRKWIVDAILMQGILKTGLCDSGTVIGFEPDDRIDPGTVYTELVDFDNFVFDPNARSMDEAMFVGDRVCVSRSMLLDSGLYNNKLLEKLPSAYSDGSSRDRAERLSGKDINWEETGELEDKVEICELWVPRAKAIVTVPGSCDSYMADDFLRVHDFYGPDEGPYTLLSLTPPVSNNPVPISMVGIWHDLHVIANRMVKKYAEQADRQKTIVGYKKGAADDAREALEASDGEAIAMDDPDSAREFNFGGQNPSNDAAIERLQVWFNMMAGNPQGMSGLSMNAKSATEASMLQGNAQTTSDDMKGLVYAGVAEEARKRAWYFHTDPLLEVPLIRRIHVPAQYQNTAMGPMMSQPPQEQEVQVILTPEARSGDFLDYTFDIESESMGRVDSKQRLEQAIAFATKIVPAAAAAAQTCAMMGVPFSFKNFVLLMAKEAGIKWMDEVFNDPEFQQKMMMLAMRGPQEGPSKGTASGSNLSGIMQNGQLPELPASPLSPEEEFNTQAQDGAAEGQAMLPVRSGY